MGETKLSVFEIEDVIEEIKIEYIGCSYDVFNKNCNHFSDEFCRKLTGNGTP